MQLTFKGAFWAYPFMIFFWFPDVNLFPFFRLSKSKNVIGRNNKQVDFYLNSNINKFLISRQHAEIQVRPNENGVMEVLIKDSSLNGTFVNDVKVNIYKGISCSFFLYCKILLHSVLSF